MAAEVSLTSRAESRLLLAAGLLCADRSAGGLGLKLSAGKEGSLALITLRAIQGLPPDVAARFKELVDWVESYERGVSSSTAVRRETVQHPTPRASVALEEVDHFAEDESGGAESEDAVLQALASVQAMDVSVDEPASERARQRA